MNKVGALFLSFLFSLTFLACAKNSNSAGSQRKTNSQPATREDDLIGKSFTDVLQIKYQRADLKCRLFNRGGAADFHLNLQDQPDDSFTWDLIHDLSVEKTFSLQSETADHQSLSLEMKVQGFGIQSLTYQDYDTKTVSEMINSPYMEYVYSVKGSYSPAPNQFVGLVGGNDFTETRRVNERVKDVIWRSGINNTEDGSHRAFYIDCSIETEINKGYEGQFKTSKL